MSYLATPAGLPYPWYVRLLFWLQRRRYGRELEPTRLWGRAPKAFVAMAAMYAALDGKSSPLDPALRALVQVRVSQINWCSFCVDLNSANCFSRDAPRFHSSPIRACSMNARRPRSRMPRPSPEAIGAPTLR